MFEKKDDTGVRSVVKWFEKEAEVIGREEEAWLIEKEPLPGERDDGNGTGDIEAVLKQCQEVDIMNVFEDVGKSYDE